MSTEQGVFVVCRYTVKPGCEERMELLLAEHWPTLQRAGLVTDEPAQVYRGLPSKKPGAPEGSPRTYVEVFAWREEGASEVAHRSPEVRAIWGPMGEICEHMEFPHFDRLATSRST